MYIVCGDVFNTTGSWRSLLERTINFILKTPTVRGRVFLLFFSSVALYHLCKQVANITRQIRKPSNLSRQFIPLFQIAICYAEFYLQLIPLIGPFHHSSFFFLSQYIAFVGSRAELAAMSSSPTPDSSGHLGCFKQIQIGSDEFSRSVSKQTLTSFGTSRSAQWSE